MVTAHRNKLLYVSTPESPPSMSNPECLVRGKVEEAAWCTLSILVLIFSCVPLSILIKSVLLANIKMELKLKSEETFTSALT